MFSKAFLMLALVGVSLALPSGIYHQDNYEKKPYSFSYGVNGGYSGSHFAQAEQSDGDVVTGYYKQVLPDGRTQKVNYVVDDINGYQAEVTYEGEAHHPEHYNAPAVYSPNYGNQNYYGS